MTRVEHLFLHNQDSDLQFHTFDNVTQALFNPWDGFMEWGLGGGDATAHGMRGGRVGC